MVVHDSQDWLQACSVEEHFMRGPALNNCWVNLSASCRQMRALGGDCYNFAFLGDGQLAMLVGDVSGKGVAAAQESERPLTDQRCNNGDDKEEASGSLIRSGG
jgi:hypothetical protein